MSNKVDKKFTEYDKNFLLLFSKFDKDDNKNLLFYKGQSFDAFSRVLDIMELAKKEVIVFDPYADRKTLEWFSVLKVNVILITMKDRKELYLSGNSLSSVGKKGSTIIKVKDSWILFSLLDIVDRLTMKK